MPLKVKEITVNETIAKSLDTLESKTVFDDFGYHQAIGIKITYLGIFQTDELLAVFFHPEDTNDIRNDFLVYCGLRFCKSIYRKNKSQLISQKLKICENVAQYLSENNSKITLNLSPDIDDIRGFTWHNFYKKNEVFSFEMRYTSYLDIRSLFNGNKKFDLNASDCQVSNSRRQIVRKCQASNFISLSDDMRISDLATLYLNTKGSQKETIRKTFIDIMTYFEATNGCIISVARDQEQQSVTFAVFSTIGDIAVYLFGGHCRDKSDQLSGTSCIIYSLEKLNRMGFSIVDLEGVNSPHRGWFKTSFGGDLKSYFELKSFSA